MKRLFVFVTILFCLSPSAQTTVSSTTAGKLEFVELEYGIGQKSETERPTQRRSSFIDE